jgi:hypothetical protein
VDNVWLPGGEIIADPNARVQMSRSPTVDAIRPTAVTGERQQWQCQPSNSASQTEKARAQLAANTLNTLGVVRNADTVIVAAPPVGT